jgi:hypothetical protein
MGRREPRDDCWFRAIAEVLQTLVAPQGLEASRSCRGELPTTAGPLS